MCLPVALSAAYKGTFAYGTIKDRVPNILTKLVDQCHKQVKHQFEAHGEKGKEDALSVVGQLSKLRSEIMTNKPLTRISDEIPDVEMWNSRFETYIKENNEEPRWFTSPWLYVECFMYRKIRSIISNSKFMNNFDPFAAQKQLAFEQSMDAVRSLSRFLAESKQSDKFLGEENLRQLFGDFLEISLWGNKCDLSISGGEETSQNHTKAHENLQALHPYLLVNDADQVWQHLRAVKAEKKSTRVDIVLDNAGFELVTDLVLAEFLLDSKLTDKIKLHPKAMPWFVSDVTQSDFAWTLEQLANEQNESVKALANNIATHLREGRIELETNDKMLAFWSYPDPMCLMRESAPHLYSELSKCDLAIFKGDLNYRKLVGDRDWPHTTPFETALGGFFPAPLCSLRTCKANVVVGLGPGQAEKAYKEDEEWMVVGKYALIQSRLK